MWRPREGTVLFSGKTKAKRTRPPIGLCRARQKQMDADCWKVPAKGKVLSGETDGFSRFLALKNSWLPAPKAFSSWIARSHYSLS